MAEVQQSFTGEFSPKRTEEFNPKEFLFRYLHAIPWALMTVTICVMVAYAKIRYTNPIYQASGRILIKSETRTSTPNGKFADLFMMQGNNGDLEDQLELVRSAAMGDLVAKAANIQLKYYLRGRFRTTAVHPSSIPLRFEFVSIVDSTQGFSSEFKVVDKDHYLLNSGKKPLRFGETVQVGTFQFRLVSLSDDLGIFSNEVLVIDWTPISQMASYLASSIQVGSSTTGSSVLTFTIQHENQQIAKDIINGFLDSYSDFTLEDKRKVAYNTIGFINEQLDTARQELITVEQQLQEFKERNKVLSLTTQADRFFQKMDLSESSSEEQEIRLKLIDNMARYIGDVRNKFKAVPVILGLEDANFTSLVNEHNRLQLQREISLNSVPSGHPLIKDLETGMSKIRQEIESSLSNAKNTLRDNLDITKGKKELAGSELSAVPAKERQYIEIMRRQKISEELYSFLLQKKLETSIGSASTLSNVQVLERASVSPLPVSPNKNSIYFTAILIGLAIPGIFLFVSEVMNDKIRDKSDVRRGTSVPLLAEVGHSEEAKTLIVSVKDRKFIAEQFRILRTNLQYILPEKKDSTTLMVTSSISGEGKSFIATNLASVMAVSGKKTVILEFDIRKPRVLKGLEISNRDLKGITNYLVGMATLDEIVMQVPGRENLWVIPCGPIPPNPAELILSPKLKQLFEELKLKFEVVVVDTAPVGMVSDGFVLGAFADATIYVVRHNYTYKKQLGMIQEIYDVSKLPHVSLVINDVQAKSGYGAYYGYGGYGYTGYGYGYRSDNHYFEPEKTNRPFDRLRRIFGV